jgi:hypothetical protein
MAKIFTPQVFEQISTLVAQGVGAAEIAQQIGCTLNSLRVKCSQQGICLRRRSRVPAEGKPHERLAIKLRGDIAVLLHQQAWMRGASAPRFAAALLEAILRDNLCNAVIDQDADPWATPAIDNGLDRPPRTKVAGPPTGAGRPRLVAKR